jgi:phenylalanyl-tRNA synthetase beta chain
MKLPVSWMRDFVDVAAEPREVAARLAACGFAVESLEGDVIDVEITANRPDGLSVYGLAREVATAFGVPLKPYHSPNLPFSQSPILPISQSPLNVPVSIGDAGCGRYALAQAEVKVAPSPAAIAERLLAAGVRPINNIVDVTNYVMLEMGHPMHAFDASRLSGPEIRVRRARAGELVRTLDGQPRTLDAAMLVIADRERTVAIAGVMGGAESEVSAGTTRIVIESAWFQPASVRATSRRLGLKTEASIRFERGADISAPPRALQRALALLAEIGAGRALGPLVDVYPRPAAGKIVALRRHRISRLLGATIPDDEIVRILRSLGFVLSPTGDGWSVEAPAFRVDIAREADLIEEVGRHWGFDRVPATFPALRSAPRPTDQAILRDRQLRGVLCGAGLQEAATFTFIEQAAATPFVPPGAELAAIANPLSEKFAVLRPSLLPGLLDAVAWNRRRDASDVRLFEIGAVFGAGPESQSVGWLLAGARQAHWSGARDAVDVFDAKGIAELVAGEFGLTVRAERADDLGWFVPGRAASLFVDSSTASIGAIGQIRPAIAVARGLGAADLVVGGVLSIDALAAAAPAGTAGLMIEPLPRHPSVVRDLSIVIDERLPAAGVRGTIRAHAPATLVSVREFDRYQGQGVPAGHVSLSIRLTFRDPDRTLTDHEVQQAVDVIVGALTREHRAVLRGAQA